MAVTLLLLLLGAEPSRPQVTLLYVRGAGALSCPEETSFKESVQARLGFDPFVPSAPLRVVAQLDHSPKGFTATLQLLKDGAAPRQRVLSSATCEELSESLLLAVVLAIDPQLMLRPEAVPEPVPIIEPTPVPPPVAPPSTPVHFRFGVGAHVAVGLSPSPAAGFSLGLGFRVGSFELLAEGQAALPSSLAVQGGAVGIQSFSGALVPCFITHFGLGACALLGAGALRVDGQFSGGTQDVSPLILPGARVQYELKILWGLELAVRLSLFAVPTQVAVYARQKQVWVTSPVAGTLGFAVTGLD